MECPNCKSTRIHRSRRRGVVEHAALPAVAVYPYRCSGCGRRFRRFHPDRPLERPRVLRDPPPWLRALGWTVFALALSLVLAFALTRMLR
jgi:DNA-directed RNA polymerase subunit RPC12/RpoP